MTEVEKVRTVIGDDGDSQQFTDAKLEFFLEQNDGELLLAASDALEALANRLVPKLQVESIGDYRLDVSMVPKELRAQADGLRKQCYETPAIGIAEENLSHFSEMGIIRNMFQRKEL